MKAKDYLLEIQRCRNRIGALQAKREELYAQVGIRAIRYDMDRVQTSMEDKLEKIAPQLLELSQEYDAAIKRYHETIRIRAEQIAGMEKEAHEEVLRLRYIETDRRGQRLQFDEIAKRMHRAPDRVRHIHGEALREFADKYL